MVKSRLKKSAPECPFECGGGDVNAIWAMPTWGGDKLEGASLSDEGWRKTPKRKTHKKLVKYSFYLCYFVYLFFFCIFRRVWGQLKVTLPLNHSSHTEWFWNISQVIGVSQERKTKTFREHKYKRTCQTIEVLHSWHSDLAIKSDTGQHLQFLRCLFWKFLNWASIHDSGCR